MDMTTFGHTTDVEQWNASNAWRQAAIADGWQAEKLYEDEALESAAKLTRDGWICQVLARDEGDGHYQASVDVWAEDRMVIKPPKVYPGFDLLQKLVRHCNECDANDVQMHRYSFAGRCCEGCLPKMRRATEQPGWTN